MCERYFLKLISQSWFRTIVRDWLFKSYVEGYEVNEIRQMYFIVKKFSFTKVELN